MSDDTANPDATTAGFAEALGDQGPDRQQKLVEAADKLRLEMESHAAQIRDLVLAQPAIELLGYLSAQLHMGILAGIREKGDEYRPDKQLIQKFQLAMEYAHAIWASHSNLKGKDQRLDEAKAGALFDKLEELESTTMMYCMASSAANLSEQSSSTEFHAKSSWSLMRGHRYQALEGEFFAYMLAPHDAALKSAYGMGAHEIASGVQGLVDAMRTGLSDAVNTIRKRQEEAYRIAEETGADIGDVIAKLKADDPTFAEEMSGAMKDLFFSGTTNLSRTSKFSAPLLEDISYEPGGNNTFSADGPFKGTPMRTLPARVRPGIKLDGEYYATDAQFIRDSLYRAIQRGVIARNGAYKVPWDNGQKQASETAYPSIFAAQFADATKYTEVFLRDPATGNWAETDLVMIFGDVLIVVEAKAGVMPMHSPATDFEKHERTIRKLIIDAYLQCKRFVEYLATAPEVPIFKLENGTYVEIAKLRKRDFRMILPIGLTVEAFTPFSAMSKELPEIQPILGEYPFVSMSVDDLFVLNRFLPTTGQLLHYLDVRQQVAGLPGAMVFDEIEHLGAYIQDNRFDMTIREQLKEADMVTWDSYGDVVDKYFENDTWRTEDPPQQEFPERLSAILNALDEKRPKGWLAVDAHIRNMSGLARKELAEFIDYLKPSLEQHAIRRMLYGYENPLQLWLCNGDVKPSLPEMKFQGQVACLIAKAKKVLVLRVSYEGNWVIDVACEEFGPPSILQLDYADFKAEADRQAQKMMKIGEAKKKAKKAKRR